MRVAWQATCLLVLVENSIIVSVERWWLNREQDNIQLVKPALHVSFSPQASEPKH